MRKNLAKILAKNLVYSWSYRLIEVHLHVKPWLRFLQSHPTSLKKMFMISCKLTAPQLHFKKTACLTKPKGRSVRWLRYLKMLVWDGISMGFFLPGKEHLKAENARKASIFLVELPRRVTRRPDAEGCRLWEAILSLSNMPGQRKWDMKSTHSIIHDQQLGYSGDLCSFTSNRDCGWSILATCYV